MPLNEQIERGRNGSEVGLWSESRAWSIQGDSGWGPQSLAPGYRPRLPLCPSNRRCRRWSPPIVVVVTFLFIKIFVQRQRQRRDHSAGNGSGSPHLHSFISSQPSSTTLFLTASLLPVGHSFGFFKMRWQHSLDLHGRHFAGGLPKP